MSRKVKDLLDILLVVTMVVFFQIGVHDVALVVLKAGGLASLVISAIAVLLVYCLIYISDAYDKDHPKGDKPHGSL